MPGLDRHLHTTEAEEHARLAFRRDCPRCRVRLTGTLPPAAVVPAPVKASVVTGLMLGAGALPSASATADERSPTTTAEIEPPEGAAPDETEAEAPVDPPSEGGTDEIETPPISAPSDEGGDDVAPLVPLPQTESNSGDSGSGDSAPAGESESGEPQSDASSGDEPRERGHREQDGDGAPSGGGAPTPLPGVGPALSDGPGGGEDRRGGDGNSDKRSSGAEGEEKGGGDTASRSNDKHVVERGDCLWAIARGALGDDASDAKVATKVAKLWELNEDEIGTGDPDLIHPGQEIRLP